MRGIGVRTLGLVVVASFPFQTAASTWTVESDHDRAWFGTSVGTAGDVNGDGFADVIVGAHMYSNGQDREGRAFVYRGFP